MGSPGARPLGQLPYWDVCLCLFGLVYVCLCLLGFDWVRLGLFEFVQLILDVCDSEGVLPVKVDKSVPPNFNDS